jgi:hypothetical protein
MSLCFQGTQAIEWICDDGKEATWTKRAFSTFNRKRYVKLSAPLNAIGFPDGGQRVLLFCDDVVVKGEQLAAIVSKATFVIKSSDCSVFDVISVIYLSIFYCNDSFCLI